METRECYKICLKDWDRYLSHKEVKGGGTKMILNAFTTRHHSASYSYWLRMSKSNSRILRFLSKIYLISLSRKFGLQIPSSTTIGEGLYIGHGIGIVINGATVIGKNVNISHFLTIGSNKGTPAIIGDNVYIGPNVCIVEDVKIGNNVKIGAGSVVINDIPDNCTSVGNPNRIINKNNR